MTAAAPLTLHTPSLLPQVGVLARRSARRSLRQPAQLVPSVIFPLVLLAINASGLDDASKIPGFPADSYLDFAFAVPFMQSALFATVNAGQGIASDIDGGFINRLALTPMRSAALVFGQLAGAASIAFIAALVYLVVGLALGVGFSAGPGGVVLLVVQAQLIALAFASLGAWIALKAGSGEAVQGVFPLLFVTFFLSSVVMPRDLIEVRWFEIVASWNPVSYMVEGMRSLVIDGWDAQAVLLGVGVSAAMILIALSAAGRALEQRMVRT